MVLENVDRIAAPTPEIFFERYVIPGRPCILTGLFDSAPLGAIDTAEKAEQRLSGLQIEVQPNYMTFLETGRRGERRAMDLSVFLERLRSPDERELCVEYPTPEELRSLLPPPPLVRHRAPDDVVSATFVAGSGNFNHLHFDDDQRDVLLYQVFGRKRFILISAAASRKLDAYIAVRPETRRALVNIPARDANGRVFFEHMSEAEREAFILSAGGWDCTLGPGETLFMPLLVWHYVEYASPAMSVTYRLGRGRLNRLIAELLPMPTCAIQSVGFRLRDESAILASHPEIVAAIDAAHADRERLLAAIDAAYEQLFGHTVENLSTMRTLYLRELL